MPDENQKRPPLRTTGDKQLDQQFEAARQYLDEVIAGMRITENDIQALLAKEKIPYPQTLTKEEMRLSQEDPAEFRVQWFNRERKKLGRPPLSELEEQDVRRGWSETISTERQAKTDQQQR